MTRLRPSLREVSGGRDGSHTGDGEAVAVLERSVVAALLLDPTQAARVEEVVAAPDFHDPKLGIVFSALCQMVADDRSVTLPLLADRLERDGRLQRVGGYEMVAELADFECTAALVMEHARGMGRAALERRACVLHAEALAGRDVRPELSNVDRQLEQLDAGGGGLVDQGFTGEQLLELADRPSPSAVEAGVPPVGHLTLLIAPKGFGKTALSLCLAAARACGTAPWEGAEVPEAAGRILYLTPDEPPEAAVHKLRGFSMFAHGWSLERAAENLTLIGPDRDLAPDVLDRLRLDEAGILSLERALTSAQQAGRPFVGVHLDAWVDFLPDGVGENDNTLVARIAGQLEALAVRFGCYVLLLHHEGKPAPGQTEGRDPRFAGRGASALNAKARCVFSLEMEPGNIHLRRVRTVTNLAACPKPALFAVCDAKAAREELLFWRPANESTVYPIADYLAVDEAISTTELAWRLSGKDRRPNEDPPGHTRAQAARLRSRWTEDGDAKEEAGERNAKLIRRVR